MKIAFFSDIHGNIYTFREFIKYIHKNKIQLSVFCGDIFGYYYYQNEIIDVLRSRKDIICTLGNHDKIFLDIIDNKVDEKEYAYKYGNTYHNIRSKISKENVEYLKAIPHCLKLQYDSINVGVFHGTPEDYLNGRLYPDGNIKNENLYTQYDYVILGHTHHKLVRYIKDTTIINPGSLGQQRDGKGCSFVVMDTISKTFTFEVIDYDIDDLVMDIKRNNDDEKFIEVLYRKNKEL